MDQLRRLAVKHSGGSPIAATTAAFVEVVLLGLVEKREVQHDVVGATSVRCNDRLL